MSIITYNDFTKVRGFLEIVSAAVISSVLVFSAIGVTDPGVLPMLAESIFV